MTCLDIGAHIGIYSVYMAKQCGAKVFSFEPTPRSFNTLKKMIALNHCENSVTAIQAAVCERSGSRSFYLNHSDIPGSDETRIAEINSLVHVDFDQHIYKEKIEVAAFSVDDFSESNHLKIGFIKIDAEGSEPDILKGARKTILKDRPSGILGIHAFAYAHKEETLIEIWNIMQEYDMVLLFDNREITESQFLAVSKMDIFDLQFFPR
jgi:FkbM family methyltransferase